MAQEIVMAGGRGSLVSFFTADLWTTLPHPVPRHCLQHSWSTDQMCKFCGCAQGQVQCSMLFLETIGDLLEKQETLGLLGHTFVFVLEHLSSTFDSRCLKAIPVQPRSSSLLIIPFPFWASSLSTSFLPSTVFFNHPQSVLQEGPALGNFGNRCGVLVIYVTMTSGFSTSVYPLLMLTATPIFVVRLNESNLCVLGPAAGGTAALLLSLGVDVAQKGNPLSLLCLNWSLRDH